MRRPPMPTSARRLADRPAASTARVLRRGPRQGSARVECHGCRSRPIGHVKGVSRATRVTSAGHRRDHLAHRTLLPVDRTAVLSLPDACPLGDHLVGVDSARGRRRPLGAARGCGRDRHRLHRHHGVESAQRLTLEHELHPGRGREGEADTLEELTPIGRRAEVDAVSTDRPSRLDDDADEPGSNRCPRCSGAVMMFASRTARRRGSGGWGRRA